MSGPFLGRQRVLAWSVVFLVIETALAAFLVLQQNGVVLPVGKSSIDFVSFYAAGKLALAGTPALAYDQAAHYMAQEAAREAGAPYVFFFYPPMFLLLCMGLAVLPYMAALLLFQAVTFALFALVLRRVMGAEVTGRRGWAWLLPVVAFPGVFWNAAQGQNGFLAASLLGGFALLLDRRPGPAGAMLGALAIKPHLGLLAPVALAAAGRWRAFAAAAAVACGLAAVSLAVFGAGTWRAYLAAMGGADEVYTSGRINFAGFVSLFGGLRLMGVATPVAYAVQGLVTLLAAACVWVVWRRRSVAGPGEESAPMALLLALTLLAVPLVLLYDQVIAVMAVAWLLRDKRGLDGWERWLLVACYPVALMAPVLALGARLPLGLAVSVVVAALCVRRGRRTLP